MRLLHRFAWSVLLGASADEGEQLVRSVDCYMPVGFLAGKGTTEDLDELGAGLSLGLGFEGGPGFGELGSIGGARFGHPPNVCSNCVRVQPLAGVAAQLDPIRLYLMDFHVMEGQRSYVWMSTTEARTEVARPA